MGKRSSASRQNLHERIRVLDLVGVLLRMGVDTMHPFSLGRTVDTGLRSVDIVVHTVQQADGDHGGDALKEDLHVLQLVDLTGAHRVVAEGTHRPSKGSSLLEESRVQAGIGYLHEFLVGELLGLFGDEALLIRGDGRRGNGFDNGVGVLAVELGNGLLRGSRRCLLSVLLILLVLDDGVVGDLGTVGELRSGTLEEQRAEDKHPPLDAVVALDDAGVHKGYEEDG